jgi:hypothetical protein
MPLGSMPSTAEEFDDDSSLEIYRRYTIGPLQPAVVETQTDAVTLTENTWLQYHSTPGLP